MKHFVLFFLSLIFFIYFLILQIINPAIISFSSYWLIVAVLFFYAALKLKKKSPFKKWQKIFAVIFLCGTAILCSVTLPMILNPKINNSTIDTEYILILGGGIKQDGTITQMPRERLITAAEYLKSHPKTKAVVTGGTLPFTNHSEAPELARELEKLGIKNERILIEDKALDTIQNFKYSAELIAKNKGCSLTEVLEMPLTIVTSSFHLRRAEILAERLGFKKTFGLSAHVPAIFVLNVYAREICAYAKLGLRIILTGEPSQIKTMQADQNLQEDLQQF